MISTITQSQIINYYHLLFIPNVLREAQIVAHDFLYCQASIPVLCVAGCKCTFEEKKCPNQDDYLLNFIIIIIFIPLPDTVPQNGHQLQQYAFKYPLVRH